VKHKFFLLIAAAAFIAGCETADRDHVMRVSVADQKMYVFKQGAPIASYDVSTSKFGLGDGRGSYRTPLGQMEVAKKIGAGAPLGMKFKNRRQTGEIVPADAPGRDPIVTRILWLRGMQAENRQAFDRGIYIHGTAAEHDIGRPRSYGCIRMRSHDVVRLFDTVGVGARVEVVPGSLQSAIASTDEAPKTVGAPKIDVVEKTESVPKTTEAPKTSRAARKPQVTKAPRVAQR
jgi:hypothetical protein